MLQLIEAYNLIMDIRPAMSSDRKALKVDYHPHRIRTAGDSGSREMLIEATDYSNVSLIQDVEILPSELLSPVDF